MTSTNSDMQTSEGHDVPVARINFVVDSSLTEGQHDDVFEGKALSMVGAGSNEFAADIAIQTNDWRGGAETSASVVVTADAAPTPVSSVAVSIEPVENAYLLNVSICRIRVFS